jgi:2'-5' RNA ligase
VLQKYFIAIVPKEPLILEIHELKTSISENYKTKGALRSPGHITLHMPFSWEEEKEEKLVGCLTNFEFKTEFQISLCGFSSFEPRVVFIDVTPEEKLIDLQKQLVQHVKLNLQLFNQSDNMRGFHPHITIAFRDLKKPMYYKLWEDLKSKPFEKQFTCQSICLLKHMGNHWEVYKEFPFSII